jgi:hypothetical protein
MCVQRAFDLCFLHCTLDVCYKQQHPQHSLLTSVTDPAGSSIARMTFGWDLPFSVVLYCSQ